MLAAPVLSGLNVEAHVCLHILTTLDSSFSGSNTCTRSDIGETNLPSPSGHQVSAYAAITLEQQGHKSIKPMPGISHSPKPSALSLSLLRCRALRLCLYSSILLRICATVKTEFGGMVDCCLTASPMLQAPPFALISARMARTYHHLGLAASGGDANGLLVGMTTLVLVLCVNLAALVVLAYMAITRQSYSWQMRREAVSCLDRAGGNMAEAVRRLREKASEMRWEMPKNPHQFIKNARDRFVATGSVLPFNRGRRSKMTAEVAMEIIDLVNSGYDVVKYIGDHPVCIQYYYTSFAQACHTNLTIANLMRLSGFSNVSSLKRHLDATYPGLMHLHPGDIKQQHTPEQRAQRVETCALALHNLQTHPHLLSRVCFMDCFHVKVKPAVRFAYYCSPNDSLGMNMVLEVPAKLIKGELKIHLIAVVNPVFGPIYMEFVSGTQADVQPIHYTAEQVVTYYVSAACSHDLPYLSHVTSAPSMLAMYSGYGTAHTMPCSDITLTCACMKLYDMTNTGWSGNLSHQSSIACTVCCPLRPPSMKCIRSVRKHARHAATLNVMSRCSWASASSWYMCSPARCCLPSTCTHMCCLGK